MTHNCSSFDSDTSSFSEAHSSYGAGFRLINQFAVFVYSQLQKILRDSFLGSISDWDNYLNLDLTQADLPFKSADYFVLKWDFHQRVTSSKLPRPSKPIDQSIAFYKTACPMLLQHEIAKSDLIRGLSCFGSAMVLDGGEDRYVSVVEQLTTYFVSRGCIIASDKTIRQAVSQYRALVAKLGK